MSRGRSSGKLQRRSVKRREEGKRMERSKGRGKVGNCTSLSDSKLHMVTVLSKEPLARRLPSQLQATEWTCRRDGDTQ